MPRKLTEPLDKFPSYLIGNSQAKTRFLESQGIHKSQKSDPEERLKTVNPNEIYQEEVIDSSTPRPPPERKIKVDRPKPQPEFGVKNLSPYPKKGKKSEKDDKSKKETEDRQTEQPERKVAKKKQVDGNNKTTNNNNKTIKTDKEKPSGQILDAEVTVPDEIVVKKSEHDMRLDRFLVKRFPNLPNSLIQRFIREKKVLK